MQGRVDIYHLIPNTTYVFRIWAKNSYGESEIVEITATTLCDARDEGMFKCILFIILRYNSL